MIKIFIIIAAILMPDGSTSFMTGHHNPDFRTEDACLMSLDDQREYLNTHLNEGYKLLDLTCKEIEDDSI